MKMVCLGPYQITARIGAGGMGEVFRAWDTRLNREVAVKVLPKDFASDADRLRRFEQETKTLASLNHPNVLTIHDAGVQEGAPYLVSELLEGKTLREEMIDAALPLRKATDYALQISQGLAAAHGKGVIHRDLKPENIFVTKDGRMKILDFGLAKLRPGSAGIPAGKSQLEELAGRMPALPAKLRPSASMPTPSSTRPSPAWCWARRLTCRPSRCAANRRTIARTFLPSAACSLRNAQRHAGVSARDAGREHERGVE